MEVAPPSRSGHVILATRGPRGSTMIHGEPKLEEVLSEPIVRFAATSAGVSAEERRAMCERLRDPLARKPDPLARKQEASRQQP